MGRLKNLKEDLNAVDLEVVVDDKIAGEQFEAWDTGVYEVSIQSAYLDESSDPASESLSLVLTLADKDDREMRKTLTLTTKDGLPYTEKNGKKNILIGYTQANELAEIVTATPLDELVEEPKVLKLYDFDTKADIDIEKDVLTELIGQQVKIAVIKREKYRSVKVGDSWEDTEEVMVLNEIDKFLDATTNKTANELVDTALETAEFILKWVEKRPSDYVRSSLKTKKGVSTKTTSAKATPKKSKLFGGK